MDAPGGGKGWHCLDAAEALAAVDATPDGLTQAEAERRLGQFGPNLLPSEPPPGWLAIGLRQLRSPLIYVLLAAAAVALALGDLTDAAFIGVVLLVNSALGGWQEWHAQQQSQSLQKLLRIRATALRDGTAVEVDAEALVPGDIVTIESGQRVPADLRLLDDHGLEAEEAALTGESLPVPKAAQWRGEPEIELGDRQNMLHAGTTIARGRGRGVVVATGSATVIGGLAITMAATERGKAPLIERMERFSRVVAVVVLAAAVVIGAVGVLVNEQSIATMFAFGVALAVSAIPEGLPVAVTVTLAIAARRMAKRGAIVRRLPAVEGLGSCTLIASDKTGTLTCNELTVREIQVAGPVVFAVSGAGYEPNGTIVAQDGAAADGPGLARALEIAVACNDADLRRREDAWAWRGEGPVRLAVARQIGPVAKPDVVARRGLHSGREFRTGRQRGRHRLLGRSGRGRLSRGRRRCLGVGNTGRQRDRCGEHLDLHGSLSQHWRRVQSLGRPLRTGAYLMSGL